MASGETLCRFTVQCNEPPIANWATFHVRNARPVLDFALTEIGLFSSIWPTNYSGLGITVLLHYCMTSAVANDINLEASFERTGEVLDIDADSFAAAQSTGDIVVPGTSGLVDIVPVVFTDGAEIDSILAGEGFRLKIERVAVAGVDAAGDLELLYIEVKET